MRTVRAMSTVNLAEVTRLAGQLGYPSTRDEITTRFQMIEKDNRQLLLVADEGGQTIGWVHATVHLSLTSEPRVEIVGLVVDENQRGKCVGKELVEAIVTWSLKCGHRTLRLGSNTSRTETHEFYRRLGFAVAKTWYVFTKPLR
jgi:GNAT superfamily N-acetyltransferase